MSNTHEEALVKIYKDMPTAEIEARLAGPDLIQLARGVAQNELQKRSARAAEPVARSPAAIPSGPPSVLSLIICSALILGVGSWLMPDMTLMFIVVTVPVLAKIIGKRAPKLSMVLGCLIIAGAVALIVYSFAFPPRTIEERMLNFVLGGIVVFVLLLFGASLISGARHKGSWRQFSKELEEQQKKAVASVTKRH